MPLPKRNYSKPDRSEKKFGSSFKKTGRGFDSAKPRSDNAKPYFKKRSEGDSFNKDSNDRRKPYGDKGGDSKRPYVKRSEDAGFGEKREYKKPYGDKGGDGKRPYVKRGEGTGFGEKREYKKPYVKRREGAGFGEKREYKKPYGDKGGDGKRPYVKRGEGTGFGEKREYKKPYGDKGGDGKRPYVKRSEGTGFGEKREYKKPYVKRSEGAGFGEKREYKKPYGDKGGDGKRPYVKRGEGTGFGEKREYKKPYGDKGGDGKRPYEKRDEGKRYGDRKFSGKKFEKRPYSKNKQEIEETSIDGEIRLNRYISNAGICSRRDADDLITAGLVSVNGTIVTEMGYKVKADDDVRYNGQRLSVEKKIYILLNKPKDTITTSDDPEGRKTVMDLFEKKLGQRIYPVGRLDRNTTGVLFLTNDGEFAQRLTHPKYGISKVYKATLDKVLQKSDAWQIANGVELEDGFIKPDAIAFPEPENKNVIGLQIHSGRNRVIHRIFESLGYIVEKLDRTAYADLTKTRLKRGEWRELEEKELKTLKRSLGMR